jgi:alkylation response protein AidB-like acyl-CoA dehydrogenase
MAQQIADTRDVDFVLNEQLKVERFSEHEKFADFNKKTINMIVKEARQLAIKEILPTQSDKGCEFTNGEVKVPEEFHKPFKLFMEGEWLGMSDSPEYGGGGMPRTVSLAASEYFIGANVSFMLYQGLSHGAMKMLEEIGTKEQKEIYLKKMYSGEWAGTMLLTEAGAGSDVGALESTAKKNDDGTYSITGNKIFISGGDQDLTENIIHPVLARIEGAPAGTRGISLFLVPKYKVNEDGSLGEFNDVICTGIEEKMGLHGNATCSLTLGGKGNCVGTLLGEENKGMKAMFLMMNEARMLVGLQGFAVATASYMYALNYARERVQSAFLLKPKEGGVPIIKHPDVRRQLLIMKSYVDAMRSLIYYSGTCFDTIAISDDEDEIQKQKGILEILTPIIKGYCTDKSWEVCSHGVQVYGGYGYCQDFPVEQLLRDSRIFMIYEGTNGIQAMDLLGRKLGLNKGKAFMDFLGEIKKTIDEANSIDSLKGLGSKLEIIYNKFTELVMLMGKTAMSEDVLAAFIHATPLLEITGDITSGWMLLWRAVTATKAMEGKVKKKDQAFYEGQLKTAEFFISSMLPVTSGKIDSINVMNTAVTDMSEEAFGSK